MSAFAAALDALFADPNIAENAIWKAGGIGSGVPVRIIRKAPDVADRFGDTRVVLPAVILDVRKAEIPAPADGDLVETGPGNMRVIGTPMIDRLGLVWTCEAVDAA
jgi:hypothetical protein